jgi:F420-non-reducing hydrogenase iron-sulfur subunit
MAKQGAKEEFEPRIVAFLCNWCTYKGADLAGTSRFHYPVNVRTIRVMCSGSVDPVYVLKALLDGADGVLIGGCHPGDCHYQSGNHKAARKIEILKTVLRSAGIDEDRVWLRWISASEGNIFRDTIDEMVKTLKVKGPNPLRHAWLMWREAQAGWKPKTIDAFERIGGGADAPG